jgi:hypothetical protein
LEAVFARRSLAGAFGGQVIGGRSGQLPSVLRYVIMTNIELLEAYARLKSLRANVPQHRVNATFVSEFHEILDLLAKVSGVSLANFRIPPAEVRPLATGGNYLTGETHYSAESYCDRNFFVMKVDGVLTMFELFMNQGSADKPVIGFKPRSN